MKEKHSTGDVSLKEEEKIMNIFLSIVYSNFRFNPVQFRLSIFL
jgi:hypothetical protein